MEPRLFPATSRLYTEMGSVFPKLLAASNASCILFSHDPAKGRIMAKTARVRAAGRGSMLALKTTTGTYEVGHDQYIRMFDGRAARIADLHEGEALFSRDVQNADGEIFIQTGQGMTAMHELVMGDIEGLGGSGVLTGTPSSYQAGVVQQVVSVTEKGVGDVVAVEVDCKSTQEAVAESGHNYMIWHDGSSFGSGIFVL